jgi:hypothetical protein
MATTRPSRRRAFHDLALVLGQHFSLDRGDAELRGHSPGRTFSKQIGMSRQEDRAAAERG